MENRVVPVSEFDFHGAQVRLVEKDGEFYFPVIDVAKALGYSEPKQSGARLLSRNPEEFDGETGVVKLTTPSGIQDTKVLSEEGAYSFAMLAQTDKGAEFRKKVRAMLKEFRRQRSPGQMEASVIRAATPLLRELVEETVAAAIHGALRAQDERNAAMAKQVAKTTGRLGTLERTAKQLARRPLQLVMDTEGADELAPTIMVALRDQRKGMGWTQAQAAVFLGISRSYFGQIEEGFADAPGWLKRRIASLFGARA